MYLCVYTYNVCLCVYTVRSGDEVISFLNQYKDIKHCNARVICSDLYEGKAISLGQKQQLNSSLSVAAANDLFRQFLCDDPAAATLQAAARVLREAPDTTNMNKRFAKAIVHFLSTD